MESTQAWFSVSIHQPTVSNDFSNFEAGQQDAPNYLPGIIAVMAINIAAVVTAVVTMVLLRWQNQQADKGEALCEDRDGFRYTL